MADCGQRRSRMKIGVISDTHLRSGFDPLVESLKRALGEVELIFHCGDWVSLELLEALQRHGWKVVGVSGNMDSPEVSRVLPQRREMELEGKRLGLVHGWGAPHGIEGRVMGLFHGIDVIIFGHTHSPFWGKREGVWLFNPGAACGWGNPRGRTVGILDVGEEVKAQVIVLEG